MESVSAESECHSEHSSSFLDFYGIFDENTRRHGTMRIRQVLHMYYKMVSVPGQHTVKTANHKDQTYHGSINKTKNYAQSLLHSCTQNNTTKSPVGGPFVIVQVHCNGTITIARPKPTGIQLHRRHVIPFQPK